MDVPAKVELLEFNAKQTWLTTFKAFLLFPLFVRLYLSLSLSLFDSFYDERFLFSKKNLFMTFYFIDLISQLCIFMVFAFAMLKVQMVPSRTSKLSQDWFDFSHLKFEWDLRDESFVLDSCKIF